MSDIRKGRQKYYNIFSHFYDLFIKMHSHNHGEETRKFLVNSAKLGEKNHPRVLDICCGTGSVALAFTQKHPNVQSIGYDFAVGMLHKAKQKDTSGRTQFINGDAARLSFADNSFDVVCCSHALYELKNEVRTAALLEMKRVVKPYGLVLIMEHEVPRKRLIKILFYIRMMSMGPKDAREFVKQGTLPFQKIFADVTLSHSQSGKSKLITCSKT
ncbi:class I SAM-dependent methyltransferase [uncultured Desulfobacter sp.]|uniref:class I SAM-dependent methyltransferase n=1 Tax=uncultured Desulfobacter sp. TaxID=240139 RepID=UPI0029F47B3D|nr:class I SAM-dependent methyltransferase [uncultured Desulfobacter sp.]